MKKTLDYKIRLTADFLQEDGSLTYKDIGLSLFDSYPAIDSSFFDNHKNEIEPDQIGEANGVIVLTPKVTRKSLSRAEDLLAIGRFGVGYDTVDVHACTDSNVLAYITAGAVDRSVAEATVGWMIALCHNVYAKDKLVRSGRWNDRSLLMGKELRDRSLGVIGLGGIAKATIKLLSNFGMKTPLAFDPFVSEDEAKNIGVQLVSLNELLRMADFVSIHCPLTQDTRGLIGAEEISQMKSDAYLINTARGGIVDEDALYSVLLNNRIAGAALDCFEKEPLTLPHRFEQLDNVLLAPHSIAWTDELFRDIGRSVCQGMIDLYEGRLPKGVINPEVVEKKEFQEKWSRLRK